MAKPSLRKRVFTMVEKDPKLPLKLVAKQFPDDPYPTIKTYRADCLRVIKRNITKKKRKKSNPSKGSKHGDSGGVASTTSLQRIESVLEKYSWNDILKLSIFKIPPFNDVDASILNFYEKQGFFRRDIEQEEDKRYHYAEPNWFYDHQQFIAKLMRRGNIFCWGPRQETGKSTLCLVLIYEYLYEHDNTLALNISTGKTLSKGLIGKVKNDPLLWAIWEYQTKIALMESITLYNSSKLFMLPCDPSAVQGWTVPLLWLDEFDKILKEKGRREALAAALPIVLMPLKTGKGRIWITGNQAVGEGAAQFEYFIRELMAFGDTFPVVSLDPDPKGTGYIADYRNNFHVTVTEQFWKDMIFRLQAALMDEAFAKAQMLNIYEGETVMFRADLIADAFESWLEENIPEFPHNTVMGVDPGAVHATGLIILALDGDGHVHEVFADEYFGGKISEKKFKNTVADLYVKHNVREGYCESNSGGLWWIDDWRERGLTFWAANFGTANPQTGDVTNATKAIERHYKERVLKHLLETHRIHLRNKQLFKEFSLYNPVESKEKGKGDLMDALLHAVFYLVGGINFIIEEINKEQGTEEVDAYVA